MRVQGWGHSILWWDISGRAHCGWLVVAPLFVLSLLGHTSALLAVPALWWAWLPPERLCAQGGLCLWELPDLPRWFL